MVAHGFKTRARDFETSFLFQPRTTSWSIDTCVPSTSTHCSEIAYLAVKSAPTAPKTSQWSQTARYSVGTIKQASKHQEKTNVSIVNNIS
ncbi:hypothetical protein GQ457_11G032680 [Hibiscus cannabinus]